MSTPLTIRQGKIFTKICGINALTVNTDELGLRIDLLSKTLTGKRYWQLTKLRGEIQALKDIQAATVDSTISKKTLYKIYYRYKSDFSYQNSIMEQYSGKRNYMRVLLKTYFPKPV